MPPRQPLGGGPGGAPKGRQRSPSIVADMLPEGIEMEHLEKLDKIMLVVTVIGIFVNIAQLNVINNHAWVKATALSDGQPFQAYLALDSVTFGTTEDPNRDNRFFCPGTRSYECDLSALCKREVSAEEYASTKLRRNTAQEAWCGFEEAGTLTNSFLLFGLLLGLVSTGMTAMYSAQAIPWVAQQFDYIEELGFSDTIQKYIMATCWCGLWILVFISMAVYALLIPDTLGWGTVELEASFGMLRLCFILISLNAALVINSCFHVWDPAAVVDIWNDFTNTPWVSARKALYIELMLQLVCYILMVVTELDWAGLLLVLLALYITGNNKTFAVLYLTLVLISILFDSIRFASLPHFDHLTPGESFGASLWIFIFALKLVIIGTMIAYEKLEAGDADNRQANKYTNFHDDEEDRGA